MISYRPFKAGRKKKFRSPDFENSLLAHATKKYRKKLAGTTAVLKCLILYQRLDTYTSASASLQETVRVYEFFSLVLIYSSQPLLNEPSLGNKD